MLEICGVPPVRHALHHISMVVACNNIVPAFRQHCRHGVGVLGPQIIRSFVILGRRRLHATAGRLDDTKPPTPADILTTLYRTRQILPSALSQNQARPWDSVLQRAGDILSGVQPHKPRIASEQNISEETLRTHLSVE